jgi:Protein of unknown function (DUF3489)
MNGVAMSIFTIGSDNNIQAFAEAPASSNPAEVFSTPKELARLTASWPAARLVELWNGFAGVVPFDDLKPVKKFTSRKAAVVRIWQAVRRLLPDVSPSVAPQAAHVAPKRARSKKSPPKAIRRARAHKGANEARKGSKKAEVLDLMRRAKGVTLAAIMEKTGWQAHTVRGFISGTITRKLGLEVESFRTADKERAYRLKA